MVRELLLALFFPEQNFFGIIDFAQLDFNNLLPRGLYFAAHEAGFNGKLTMAAIDQHTELYLLRTSLLEKCVHGGAHGASSVENVIHQDDVLAGDGKLHFRFLHYRRRSHSRKIVAIQRNVESAHGYLSFFDSPDHLTQPLGQKHSTSAD